MAKIEKNHEFRSFEIISLFLLAAACILVILPIMGGRLVNHQEPALRRAESLGYQVLESHRSSRGPASVQETGLNHLSADEGTIGQDPWGRPYQFKYFKSGDPQKTKVVVWSKGANGVADTSSETFASNKDSLEFGGDDVGVIVPIK